MNAVASVEWSSVDPVKHSSLARSAADWIAARIAAGEIKPGEKLTEVGLAERMGVSRSPVREALQALAREGLISREPRLGARVARLDARDAADLYDCRLMLEPRCAALAVHAMDRTTATRWAPIFSRMTAAVAVNDAMEYLEALKEYNSTLLEACPNRTLVMLSMISWRSSLRYWSLLVRGSDEYLKRSLARNEALNAAVAQRDGERTEHTAVQTLELGRDELLKLLKNLSQ